MNWSFSGSRIFLKCRRQWYFNGISPTKADEAFAAFYAVEYGSEI